MPTRQHDPKTASTIPIRRHIDLLNRLKHLEGVVEHLSSELNGINPPDGTQQMERLVAAKDSIYHLSQDFGKIHINDTSNIYIGNNFWDVLQREVCRFL